MKVLRIGALGLGLMILGSFLKIEVSGINGEYRLLQQPAISIKAILYQIIYHLISSMFSGLII
jgi:hypothetical protein